jgi:hypothetical protein
LHPINVLNEGQEIMERVELFLAVGLLSALASAACGQAWLHAVYAGPGSHRGAVAISADGNHAIDVETNYGDYSFLWSLPTSWQTIPPVEPHHYVSARGVSADASWVVATSFDNGFTGYLWSPVTNQFIVLGDAFPAGITPDGTVVIGSKGLDGQAFRWTAATGVVMLGWLFQPDEQSYAAGVSPDGSVIVGAARPPGGVWTAFRWTESTGMQSLGSLAPGAASRASTVSADGHIVVGEANRTATLREAFWWTQKTGMLGFGEVFPAQSMGAAGISADGSVIVGSPAFIWTRSRGVQRLEDVLEEQGVPPNPYLFIIQTATGVSADGRRIVGRGQDSGASGYATGPYMAQIDLPCYANCDLSVTPPILTVDDFLCFIDRFADGHSLPYEQQVLHYANCDGSGAMPVLNVDDFICFISAFAQGCP